jgi:uncharacterized protein YyaL (SSP411 family)
VAQRIRPTEQRDRGHAERGRHVQRARVAGHHQARALSERIETHFRDGELGGYFTTGEGHEALITRVKSVHDGALPAGSGTWPPVAAKDQKLAGKDRA